MSIQSSDALRCWFLQSRDEYQTCHIRLPDGESLSAIALNGQYYGFRRRLTLGSQVLKLLYSISDPSAARRITEVALTLNPKGYFLWVHEPNATLTGRALAPQCNSQKPVYFVKLPVDYTYAKIRVPDLNQVLSAIEFAGCYYSLFKIEPNPDVVLDLVSKLSHRDDEILVAALSEGSLAICLLEPEANPA